MAGQTPFREMEAAKLYQAGWAPQIFVVREAVTDESQALKQLGIKKPQSWELSRGVLIQQGVPSSAIIIPEGDAVGTLEELQAVWDELRRRSWESEESVVRSDGSEAGGQKAAINNPREAESTKPSVNSVSSVVVNNPEIRNPKSEILPVILVTSKYHTKRTRLTWQYVTGGQSQPIVRAASHDPFDPERWWQQRSFVLSVVREYLGLANYYLGFPVTP